MEISSATFEVRFDEGGRAQRSDCHRWALLVAVLCLGGLAGNSSAAGQSGSGVMLPYGREFVSWEQSFKFTTTYYVNNRNPRAADSNPGTKELPFSTINKAAQVLEKNPSHVPARSRLRL
jgi:hypothetical protein